MTAQHLVLNYMLDTQAEKDAASDHAYTRFSIQDLSASLDIPESTVRGAVVALQEAGIVAGGHKSSGHGMVYRALTDEDRALRRRRDALRNILASLDIHETSLGNHRDPIVHLRFSDVERLLRDGAFSA